MVNPKLSGVHRFACLSLYRALLRQCSPSASDPSWLGETRILVKQRFRKYRGLDSPTQIANSLKAGYKTLDLLSSASNGSSRDARRLSDILEQTKVAKAQCAAQQKELKDLAAPQPLSAKRARKQESIRYEEKTRYRHPDTPSILARPKPVKGIRKVPYLVNARGLPFLRIKKPQPRNLSGVIRNKLERRWKRILRRDRLTIDKLFAEDEDNWDHLTNAQDSSTWSRHYKLALDEVNDQIRESDENAAEMARKMWNIVLKERLLAEEEQKKRYQDAGSVVG
ncbi:Complex 1 LYR protein [Penicillium citrinum]|uniref:Complex 1 LYR protein n=1 Tax=Penicillium citrinum TaxID=5077 RepID=A0A9W9TGE8_PENCI|nr:Complex 1 LYR protein [Penicillium citrinum]KAJ5221718.1 Complex 1 LYR protein [Penicillium citrinum]